MSVLDKLTEGIVNRDLRKEGDAVVSKWDKTGLLEGLNGNNRSSMARLLENQAKELLREASSMAAGDVEGFAAVAFPIVRRVFGGLVANDLVSVQPMSLPSGLIFFLDFTYEDSRDMGVLAGESVYGGGVVASQITGGVNQLTGSGFYNLANAQSSPTGSSTALTDVTSGDPNAQSTMTVTVEATATNTPFAIGGTKISELSDGQKTAIRHDPDVLAQTAGRVYSCTVLLSKAQRDRFNQNLLTTWSLVNAIEGEDGTFEDFGLSANNITLVRRLTEKGTRNASGKLRTDATNHELLFTFYYVTNVDTAGNFVTSTTNLTALRAPMADQFNAANAIGAVVGGNVWGLEEPSPSTGNVGVTKEAGNKNTIAEIDIKVDSIAVTAITKKLKAKWSPELGQDLNAYHNLDAEVELTSILSEHIALEIDREILNDLVKGATAGTYYWSRAPGLFVHRTLGTELGASSAAPDFTGTVSEWYETLVETINDVSAQIHRKTLRGGATFLVTSPEVANILEFTSGFRANITHDDDKGTVGAVKSGSISKKWDVYVDPYFPRNLVLVGRKGGSFLESGYVYAPYVPLQVTPTIFGTEDFVPRKGVMTRYAKKMVRPDMYGLVVVRGLLGEAGATS
jgi:hypothetical protein